jgi:hypothetical protein
MRCLRTLLIVSAGIVAAQTVGATSATAKGCRHGGPSYYRVSDCHPNRAAVRKFAARAYRPARVAECCPRPYRRPARYYRPVVQQVVVTRVVYYRIAPLRVPSTYYELDSKTLRAGSERWHEQKQREGGT